MVHETIGTTITTNDEPGMHSQHTHKKNNNSVLDFQSAFVRRLRVHAIPEVKNDDVPHHGLSQQTWTTKKFSGSHAHGEGSPGSLLVYELCVALYSILWACLLGQILGVI